MSLASHPSVSLAAAQYRVGDLTIDLGSQRVTRGGDVIPLPKLSFDLLLALTRAAPNLVSIDGLMHEVWPNLVVNPETVSQRVKLLRDALGDNPHAPRYIEGLRGRGYRMIAPVSQIASGPAEQAGEPPVSAPELSEPRSSTRVRHWIPVATIGTIVLLVAAATFVITRMVESSKETPTSVTVSALPDHTVAVLPFANLSNNAQDEFVALGIAEGVLHRLAAIRDLTLIARTSSFSLRGKPADAREIGLALNARYLVEGSVQRRENRLRVSAQLIDAATGVQMWSLRFDRTMDDIFAVEDEISHSVAGALEVSLTQGTHPFARFGIDAYLAFLRGKALVATRKVADAELAIESFSRAIELAPDFAAAYAALADAHMHLALINGVLGTESDATVAIQHRAQALLTRALQLDESLGEAYIARANLKQLEKDDKGAEADYRRGLELSPNDAVGHEHLADFLSQQGRLEEALVEIDQARRIDPLSPRNHYIKSLILADINGPLAEREALLLQALRVAPNFHPALARLAVVRAAQGRLAESAALAEQAVAIDPRQPWIVTRPVHFYLELEDVEAARRFAVEQAESVRWALWLPICLYERKPERAAEILRAHPERWSDGLSEDVEAYVIRDAAVLSGRLAKAKGELAPLYHEDGAAKTMVQAQLSLALGDKREAERLARKVLDLDPHPVRTTAQAMAFAILGEHEAAIDRLAQTFEQGGRRWWYTFEREPAFESLRGDPRFQALAAKARMRAATQRKLLEQMRERGEVPRRPASASPTPC
ncbi:MAG TPA: winged helix-turn-helix domain-containing protein [Steroidobacter sp.]|uniref:TPR end-of-group domain-containing protein n=1 Tax=Steroidobacter sp. TaxID=1978227 RepID=UPI002EDAC505